MSRVLLIGLAVAGLSVFSTAEAFAQRDSGAKARGDYRAFWDPGYRRSSGMFSGQASTPVETSYRRFSYMPAQFNPGDAVVVDRDNVNMMKGDDVVGAVPNGMKFKVTKVVNGWLGAVVEVDGKKLNGWIWRGNVAHDQSAARTAETQPQRRYSYEPAQTYRSYRSYERTQEPWKYLKTDPRRYRGF